jgi:eukaryotic-like serine/threonine-protein kinase
VIEISNLQHRGHSRDLVALLCHLAVVAATNSGAATRASVDESISVAWEHPFADLREAVRRKPSAWLARLRVDVVASDPLLVARIPAVYRKLTAAGVPHVLPLRGVEIGDDGRLVLVYRHEAGESLAQRLARGPLPIADALVILRELCRTIAAAHRVGVEHRALGPASVLLGRHPGEIWITDFGVADLFVHPRRSIAAPDELDAPDVALHPMTPERSGEAGPAGSEDVYLLGCLAYWMLAGVPPFAALDLGELARRHASQHARGLDELVGAAMPFSLLDAVARALHKDPEHRYPDVEALDRVLAHAQHEAGAASVAVPRVDSLPPRRTNPFGTDPPRVVSRQEALRREGLAATMVITEADRAALPRGPGLRAAESSITGVVALPSRLPMPRSGRVGIAIGVLGVVLAAIIVVWPVEPHQPQWRIAEPSRSAAIVAPRGRAPESPVIVPDVPSDVEPLQDAAAPLAIEPAPGIPVGRAEPAASDRPRAATRATAAPTHTSPQCERVRRVAADARESYDWPGLLEASSRSDCWCGREEPIALRAKALMELGRFDECARAVELVETQDAALARVGLLCRRRAQPPS